MVFLYVTTLKSQPQHHFDGTGLYTCRSVIKRYVVSRIVDCRTVKAHTFRYFKCQLRFDLIHELMTNISKGESVSPRLLIPRTAGGHCTPDMT